MQHADNGQHAPGGWRLREPLRQIARRVRIMGHIQNDARGLAHNLETPPAAAEDESVRRRHH
ncbi:hypothetical protein BN129_4166 [Cronobacter sakazakii 701]|nr:hypothetical protein BN129_4166 [Cronobacter sakazakii 701]